MNVKTWTKKIAGASVVGVLLAGAGMTAALAATPTATIPGGSYQMSEVTNLTPYTWTLYTGSSPQGGPWLVTPPLTVAPGQTAQWVADDNGDFGSWNESTGTTYTFTDTAGQNHVMFIDESTNPNNTHYNSYSYDRQPSGHWVESSAYHMAMDPDGLFRHADAIWNSPTTVTIDGAKDSADAQGIVSSELPRVSADKVTWTPSSSTPTFQQVNKEQISSTVENYSSAPASLDVDHLTSVGESTSIGEETSVSLSTKVFGFVAKVTASVTNEQEWGTSDSVKISQGTEIEPSCSGYLYRDNSIATVTGDLTFTVPEGTTFVIKNVAVSRGDIIDPHGSMHSGMNVSAAVSPLTSGADCAAQ